jgi:hypothetical protein
VYVCYIIAFSAVNFLLCIVCHIIFSAAGLSIFGTVLESVLVLVAASTTAWICPCRLLPPWFVSASLGLVLGACSTLFLAVRA